MMKSRGSRVGGSGRFFRVSELVRRKEGVLHLGRTGCAKTLWETEAWRPGKLKEGHSGWGAASMKTCSELEVERVFRQF